MASEVDRRRSRIGRARGGTGSTRRARRQLPANYRTAVEALERYLMYFGPWRTATALLSMLEDLADLFEQSAADGTPIREIVGEDPVEFAEAFLRNYPEGQWIDRERERLTNAIERAAGDDAGNERDGVR